jgi:hypothetical protein
VAATPRTALRLDPDLKRRATERARAEGATLSEWIEAAMERALAGDRLVYAPRAERRRQLDPRDCPHPLGMRVKGTDLCGRCGGTYRR